MTDPDGKEPGEFRCPDCRSRCTRGPSGIEYGHTHGDDRGGVKGCPRRPREFVDSDRNNPSPPTNPRDSSGRFKSKGGA